MRKLVALIAVMTTLVFSGVASGARPLNVDDGGGGSTPVGIYYSQVYTYYDGYWHYVNCEWLVFPWGVVQNRCW